MSKKVTAIILALLMLALIGCGAEPEATPAPTPEPTPTPTPTPTPFPEPSLDMLGAVTIAGQEYPEGLYMKDDTLYVKLSDLAQAIEVETEQTGDSFSFPWRNDTVSVSADANWLEYLGQRRILTAQTILCGGGYDLYLPVESFCRAVEVGAYYDEEMDHWYFTPASGDWYLPLGYNVPVMMYHGIAVANADANLMVDPSDFEQQLKYLTENGYTTIWFEDLWHVQDFEKPVILTFDDGWANNYTVMLPILEKYGCKATVFVVPGFLDISGVHVTTEQLLALAASENISIQSHTVNHEWLSLLSRETQEYELCESKKRITRLIGKEPFVLCYPYGDYTETTRELVREYYRFGVKMTGYEPYNTSDDPTLVYRFFPQRQTQLEEYVSWLALSFR